MTKSIGSKLTKHEVDTRIRSFTAPCGPEVVTHEYSVDDSYECVAQCETEMNNKW